MGGNRVEELESKVRELEATVDGLTDELLECKERIEALEEEVDPDMDIIEGGITTTSSQSPSSPPGEEATGPAGSPSEDGTAADSDNTGDDESGGESDADDIIVA